MPIIEKTVEVQQLQFSEQVMNAPVAMKDRRVRFRRENALKPTQVHYIDKNAVVLVLQ